MNEKILIGDDHELIRTGVTAIIRSLGYEFIKEARTNNEIMKFLKDEEFTHAVLDLELTDGFILEIIPNIRRLYPDLHIAILSMQQSGIYRMAVKQFQVEYFVSKISSTEEIRLLIKKFLQNEPSPINAAYSDIPANPFSRLAPQELVVLGYLVKGYTQNEISSAMNLAQQTVNTYRSRINEKTGTTKLFDLIELARLYNIV